MWSTGEKSGGCSFNLLPKQGHRIRKQWQILQNKKRKSILASTSGLWSLRIKPLHPWASWRPYKTYPENAHVTCWVIPLADTQTNTLKHGLFGRYRKEKDGRRIPNLFFIPPTEDTQRCASCRQHLPLLSSCWQTASHTITIHLHISLRIYIVMESFVIVWHTDWLRADNERAVFILAVPFTPSPRWAERLYAISHWAVKLLKLIMLLVPAESRQLIKVIKNPRYQAHRSVF